MKHFQDESEILDETFKRNLISERNSEKKIGQKIEGLLDINGFEHFLNDVTLVFITLLYLFKIIIYLI